MGESLARLASLLLAAAFFWAALAKLVSFGAWREALRGYGLPRAVERVSSVGVLVAELATAVLAVVGDTRVAGALAAVLVAGFSLAILQARVRQGDRLPCGCFGGRGARDFRLLLGRNALLTILVTGMLLGPGQPVLSLGGGSWSDALPASLVAVGLLMLAWMVFRTAALLRNRNY